MIQNSIHDIFFKNMGKESLHFLLLYYMFSAEDQRNAHFLIFTQV